MAGEREGVVAFLFTDIEGSTTLFEKHPEEYPRAVAGHHELLRTAFEAHGGRVFETVGDAAYAAFVRPADAIRAALEAQRALQTERWGELGEIRVRMGIHSGPAEQRDGRYYGPTVQRSEKLASSAHGRQIVISAATASAARGDLPANVSFRDMGSHRLRGLPSPEHIFQVVGPTLPADFPALRTLTAVLSRLPSYPGSFIDREREMDEIKRSLSGSRLVTIGGPAGIGKTRTALELVPALLDDHPDGAWFIGLEHTGSGGVAGRFAEALGVKAGEGQDLVARLTAHLGPKQLLLVVDRPEHVLAECARLIDTLLRSCRHLKILATSRDLLAMTGEVAVRLASLSKLSAQVLFLDRARQARPDFRLSDADEVALDHLRDDLDGIPEAIERIAAQVVDHSLREILARWHATAMSGSGYELLSPSERLLVHRLAQLEGSWTLDQAEEIGGGGPIQQADVLDLLAALVDRSVIITDTSDEGVRYRMPESLRRFCQQHLEAAASA